MPYNYTERYVGATLSGDGSGDSVANCWDWATALTSLAAGERLNVFEDITSTSNDTFTNNGSAASPMAIRGVQSDGTPFSDVASRTDDSGPLSTSFPAYINNDHPSGDALKLPGVCEVSGIHFQSSSNSGAIVAEGTSASNNYCIVRDCIFTSTGNTRCIDCEVRYFVIFNCDINVGNTIGSALNRCLISHCRFVGSGANTNYALTTKGLGGSVVNCQFIDVDYCIRGTTITALEIQHCSFRNCDTAFNQSDSSAAVMIANCVAYGSGDSGSKFFLGSGNAAATLINNAVGNFADADQNNQWEEVNRITLSSDPFTSSSDLALNSEADGGTLCQAAGTFGKDLGAIQAASSGGGRRRTKHHYHRFGVGR